MILTEDVFPPDTPYFLRTRTATVTSRGASARMEARISSMVLPRTVTWYLRGPSSGVVSAVGRRRYQKGMSNSSQRHTRSAGLYRWPWAVAFALELSMNSSLTPPSQTRMRTRSICCQGRYVAWQRRCPRRRVYGGRPSHTPVPSAVNALMRTELTTARNVSMAPSNPATALIRNQSGGHWLSASQATATAYHTGACQR